MGPIPRWRKLMEDFRQDLADKQTVPVPEIGTLQMGPTNTIILYWYKGGHKDVTGSELDALLRIAAIWTQQVLIEEKKRAAKAKKEQGS